MKKRIEHILNEYKELVDDAIKDLKCKKTRYKQIPNLLTTARLTAPLFIIPASLSGNIFLTVFLIGAFGITDFLDGQIARRCNLTSKLGKDLDAIADKIFAGTLLFASSFNTPLLLINLILEAVISGINSYKVINKEEVKSTMTGKIKTWFVFILSGMGLLVPYINLAKIINPLMLLTTIMQVGTIRSYVVNKEHAKKDVKKNAKNKERQEELQEEQLEGKEQMKDKKATKEYKLIEHQKQKFHNKLNKEINELNKLKGKLNELKEIDEKVEIKPDIVVDDNIDKELYKLLEMKYKLEQMKYNEEQEEIKKYVKK